MFKLLQVCNIGQIVGGTAACAWSVTRALPDWQHTVAFLSSFTAETRATFAPHELLQWNAVTPGQVAAQAPDLVLLHNTSRQRCPEPLPVWTVNYLHSRITPAPADHYLICSDWLASHGCNYTGTVCWQGVPMSRYSERSESRTLRTTLVVGRMCTPQVKKWPREIVDCYGRLAQQFPEIRWEFVGCPLELQPALQAAVSGQAVFHAAGWGQRALFWNWDVLLYHNPQVPESFGRTVAEAMRCGCIPVVDRQGGFVEQVVAGTGCLCEAEAEFAMALEQLQDPGERSRRRRACRVHADEHFSLAAFRQRLLQAVGTRPGSS